MKDHVFNDSMPFMIPREAYGDFKFFDLTDEGEEIRQYRGKLFVAEGHSEQGRVYCHIGAPEKYCVSIGLHMINTFSAKRATMAQLEAAKF